MKKLTTYSLLLLAALLLVTGCHRRRNIPESTLREILREAFISEAIARHTKDPDLQPSDSLDIHGPILEKYGYSLDDFRYTIDQMASRKSNPMGRILASVATDIEASSKQAEQRYKIVQRIDSAAFAVATDTVLRIDTVLRGKLDGYEFLYSRVFKGDSTVSPGTYKLQFLYSTGSHARSYTKSVRYRRVRDEPENENTLWIPIAKDTTVYNGEFVVGGDVRRIDFRLRETYRAGQSNDTSYLRNIRLIYVPPVDSARRRLYQHLTGFYPTIDELYEQREIDSLKNAGLPLLPGAGR